jgi:two-component system response regulator DevR
MRLIIVDDHSLFRGALVHLFNSQPDFEVVGEAATVTEALSLVDTQRPDLVIMDIGLPDGSGIEAISKILKKKPDANIVLLTIRTSDESPARHHSEHASPLHPQTRQPIVSHDGC